MKKLLFVFNPNAGKGLIKTELVGILDISIKEGYLPTVYPTQSKRDAYKMIKKMEEKYDLIVCSGGDGTLDEVVGAVVKYHKKYHVGYIPAGSTNDFAKSLGISKNMRSAALAAVNG